MWPVFEQPVHVVRKWQHLLRKGRGSKPGGGGWGHIHRHVTQKMLTYRLVDNLSLIRRTYPDAHTLTASFVWFHRESVSLWPGVRSRGRTASGHSQEHWKEIRTLNISRTVFRIVFVSLSLHCKVGRGKKKRFWQGDIKWKMWPRTFFCASVSRDNRMLWILRNWIHLMWLLLCHSRYNCTRALLSSPNNCSLQLLSAAVCFPSSRWRVMLADLQMIISQ